MKYNVQLKIYAFSEVQLYWNIKIFYCLWEIYQELTLPIQGKGYFRPAHYNDIIMGTIASQITSLTIVYSIINSGADQRKHQSSASLAFVWGIHRRPVNSPHKWPVMRKKFPFDDVIMLCDNMPVDALAPCISIPCIARSSSHNFHNKH